MNKFLLLSFFFISGFGFGQSVTIEGFAPKYVGKTLSVYKIEDYLSYNEVLLGSTTVGRDSLFAISFESKNEQKIILRSANNKGYMLVQPEANYKIYFPEKDKYAPFKPSGTEVEVSFLALDSTDINYKVLGFQRWIDHFLGNNYHLKSVDVEQFMSNLDRFKENVQKAYAEDTSIYLKAHIRFSIAGLDNIPTAAERNRYEKYDFYLKKTPVYYNVEAYMNYVSDFYQQLIPRLSNEANQEVYDAVIRSSPTLMMKALGTEYTLGNLQIRELVMIKMLSEAYRSPNFPQTNVLSMLDSLSNVAMVPNHRVIATNLTERLTQLVPGGKAPNIVFIEQGKETKTIQSFSGKHLYIHFLDPESLRSQQELPLLKELHEKYSPYVHFVSVYKSGELSEDAISALSIIDWDIYGLPESNLVWKKYRIESFPQYTLIDATGYVVASPSLAPTPNGEYQTIDESFFYIKKKVEQNQ